MINTSRWLTNTINKQFDASQYQCLSGLVMFSGCDAVEDHIILKCAQANLYTFTKVYSLKAYRFACAHFNMQYVSNQQRIPELFFLIFFLCKYLQLLSDITLLFFTLQLLFHLWKWLNSTSPPHTVSKTLFYLEIDLKKLFMSNTKFMVTFLNINTIQYNTQCLRKWISYLIHIYIVKIR